MKRFIFLILLIILQPSQFFAQNSLKEKQKRALEKVRNETDIIELQKFQKRANTKYERERAKAIKWAKKNGYFIEKKLKNGKRISLYRLDKKGRPIYRTTRNDTSARTISTNKIQPNGVSGLNLTGSGIDIGIWDGDAVHTGHTALYPQVIVIDSADTAIGDHATHVAGTMISNGVVPKSKGMAPNAGLFSYQWNNDISEMSQAAISIPGYQRPLMLSNHSYGNLGGWEYQDSKWVWYGDPNSSTDDRFGNYNWGGLASSIDSVAYLAPYYSIVWAAGNDRGNGPNAGATHYHVGNPAQQNDTHDKDGGLNGYDCIIGRALAKNIITVGAVDDLPNGYQNNGSVKQDSTKFSSWGPALGPLFSDGRIKPDLVANGWKLFSSVYHKNGVDTLQTGNDFYAYKSGTSMATPSVTGSLALLLQHYRNKHNQNYPKAATLKALVLHTADDAGTVGPDYKFGWGLMNSETAADVITASSNDPKIIQELSLSNGETKTIEVTANGNEPLKVTIVWTDPPKDSPSDPILINDLDIRVTNNGNTYKPWILDPINPSVAATKGDNDKDNIEQIYIDNPTSGQKYTIKVTHKGNLHLGENQDFSMIVTGIDVPANAVQISQVDKNNSLFGNFGYWVTTGSYWNYWPSGQILQREAKMTLKAHQGFAPNTTQKFNFWKRNDIIYSYRNWEKITTHSNTNQLIAQFNETSDATIQTALEGFTSISGGDISFKDPWKKDDNSDTQKGVRNRGSNAIMLPYGSPLNVNTNNNDFMGVLLEQYIPSGTYYSVEAQNQQIIAGKNSTFFNWSATGADITSTNSLSTAVVFRQDGAVVQANYKGVQLSNDANTFSNNNQRKFARTGGYLYSIYESMGKIWLEKSENNGETWTIINNGKPLNGDTEAKNPSFFVLSHAPETIAVVFQETDPHQIRVMVSSDDFDNIEFDGVVEVLTYDYSYNCNPVISMAYNYDYGETYLIIWQSDDDLDHSAGLYYRGFAINSSDDYNFINSSTKINNTNQNSKSSTIAAIVDVSSNDNDFYLAWEQYVSSVESKIYFYRVRRTGSNSFSFFDFAEPTSGSGFTVNTAPSITVLPNGNPVLVWDGGDKIIKREKGFSGWSSFSYYGGNNPANPQARIVGSEEAIVWSESNSILKFAQGSDVYCFDIEGDYIQLTDAESLNSMNCSVFNTSSQPYYFTTVGYDDIYPSNSLPETISSDLTVTGNLTISSNTTILDGATLTILEGTTLTFQNNSKLIVNGTLNVNGTSGNKVQFDFQTPYSSDGEYNGIDIKQGGSATIDYAEIKNAHYGIKAEKTAITVENSDIHDCVIGTYLYWTNDYGFSEIHSNNLHNNSCCGLYVYHSEAKARDNQIKNNGNRGVFAGNHSTLYLGEAGYAGNNNISNNTTVGIFSDYGSYMFLGRETCTLQGGNNIVNNPSKNARASGYGSVIQAENTWWGSNNQSTITSKFTIGSGSHIYYIPWLSSEPSGVLSKSVTTPEESVYNAEFTSPDKSEPESEVSEDKQYNYDSKWSIYWKLLYARNLIFVKDYKFAREICREVIDENPDSSLSFWALNLLGVASYQDDPEGFKEYLQKKTSTKEKKQLYGSMELILSGYETTKSSKEASIDKTTTKYEGTYIEEVGLLQKFMYYLNEEKDEKTARNISDELDKKFPKTVSAIEAHRFLGDDVKESVEIKGEIAKENGKDDNESIPEKYELLGNYPNPFNPSTTIKYALPFNSNVELTIYDLSGKEIKSFRINSQSSGYNNVVWDGTNNNGIQVSSGVYVYKFKAVSLEGNGKVFEKSSKLMMLK